LNSALNAVLPISPTLTVHTLGAAPCFFHNAAPDCTCSMNLATLAPGTALNMYWTTTAMTELLVGIGTVHAY
jgi:hypothetical protein